MYHFEITSARCCYEWLISGGCWAAGVADKVHNTMCAAGDTEFLTRRFCYYGYKFEDLCTGDDGVVDATSEFAAVLRYRLGRHRLVMAAEIDCRDPSAASNPQGTDAYMELKTYK